MKLIMKIEKMGINYIFIFCPALTFLKVVFLEMLFPLFPEFFKNVRGTPIIERRMPFIGSFVGCSN